MYLIDSLYGRVEIIQPYHPLYVKVGDNLEIQCQSDKRGTLGWVRQTPFSTWQDSAIEPIAGGEWSVTLCKEEPSGFVQSKVIKHNVQLLDRGSYTCTDKTNLHSFAIWVTALQINYRNLTLFNNQERLTLQCNISGFDNNPPPIDYAWTKGGYEVVQEDRITSHLTDMGHLSLIIRDPVPGDVGHYQCLFFLYTNLGPITLQQDLYVDPSPDLVSAALDLNSHTLSILILYAVVALFMMLGEA